MLASQPTVKISKKTIILYWLWLFLNFFAVVLVDAHYEIYEDTGQLKPYLATTFDYTYLMATVLTTVLFGVWLFRKSHRVSFYLSLLLLILIIGMHLAKINY